MHKAHLLIVRPDVGPVNIQDVDGVFRHPDLPQHFVERILRHPQEVRELLHEQAFVDKGVSLFVQAVQHMVVEVVVRRAAFLRQFKEGPHRFFGTRNRLLHGLDHILHPAREAEVEAFSASCGSDAPVQFRNQAPVDVQFVFLHQELSCHRPVSGRAERTEFVQRGVEFKPSPDKACRTSSRHVVLFEKKDLLSRRSKAQRRGQTACARAYYDSVKFAHKPFHPF